MRRLIFGYAPSTLVPALVSILGIYIFTRVLSTHAFGNYNLSFSVAMVAQSVIFFAPNLAITRFYAQADTGAGAAAFLKLTYLVFLAASTLTLVGFALLWWAAPTTLDAAGTELLVVPLLLLRSLVATNQTINRAAGRMARFNAIECLQAVLGLAAGLGLVLAHDASGADVMLGLIGSAAVCAVIDLPLLRSVTMRVGIDRALLRQMLQFCWPLALAFIVTCSLQYADRFLVDTFAGPAALGIYVVAFSLVDRPISLICLSITAGTFQLAVDTYVRDGAEAGRRQAGHNGAVLLGLALPACLGLMLASRSIAEVLVGPAYRDGVAVLIPIMAATALLRGVGAHYVDHAFHLGNRSLRLFAVYAPSALGNIVLSAVLVPRYGMVAAAYGALACQAAALLAGWIAARRVLPLWLPMREMAGIAAGLAAMAAAVAAVPLPPGWVGLGVRAAIGMLIYGGVAVALDLGGLRSLLGRRRHARPPVKPSSHTAKAEA